MKREAQPERAEPSPPAWLTAEAKRVFRRTTKQLTPLGLCTAIDGPALAIWCQTYADLAAVQKALTDGDLVEQSDRSGLYRIAALQRLAMDLRAQVSKYGRAFGLDPASRGGIDVVPLSAGHNPWDEFRSEGVTRYGINT